VGTPKVEDSAIIVELRLNCNLHDLTIEQILAKMMKVLRMLSLVASTLYTLYSLHSLYGTVPYSLQVSDCITRCTRCTHYTVVSTRQYCIVSSKCSEYDEYSVYYSRILPCSLQVFSCSTSCTHYTHYTVLSSTHCRYVTVDCSTRCIRHTYYRSRTHCRYVALAHAVLQALSLYKKSQFGVNYHFF
jgi:hypothetical protein